MATYGSLRHLRDGMLVGCAHGALIAVACVLFAADAGAADRTIVIGGSAARHPGTIVIGGSGTARAYDQVAGLPSGGSVQVDLGAIDGTSRIRLRPPGPAPGYAPPAARNSLALRPPSAAGSAGRGPIQLAETLSAPSGRIVLRPPLPTPRPAPDMAYRAPAGGTNADTAALNRTQLAEVAADAPLRVSIPVRRPDLQPPPQGVSAPRRLLAPLSDDSGPARAQFAAVPRAPQSPELRTPEPRTTELRTPDARPPEMRGLDVRGQDARSLNLAVLAAVDAAPQAPLSVSVAPAPAPIRTETHTARLADDLRPRTVGPDPMPVLPPEPEPEAPPPVATIGVGVPSRQPPPPVTPHQQTAALPPDPTIAARPTIYWTSPRVDAPPPPADLPRVEAPATEVPAAERRQAGSPAPEPAPIMPAAPLPAAPLPADEPAVGLLPTDRYRPVAPGAAAPTETPIVTWEPPSPPAEAEAAPAVRAPLPDAPAGIVSVADRYAGPAYEGHADRPTERYGAPRAGDRTRPLLGERSRLNDRGVSDRGLGDHGLGPAGREGHPSMPGVPSADVERTPSGGLIESLMGREAGIPVAAPSTTRVPSPLPPRAPLRQSTVLPTAADAPADDRLPEPDRVTAPAPQPSAASRRRTLTADEEASLAAASGERPRNRPTAYLPPVAAFAADPVSEGSGVAPPESADAIPSPPAPSDPAPATPASITWTSPPQPAPQGPTPEAARAETAAPTPFTPAEVSALGAASGTARAPIAATEILAPEPTYDRAAATPQPVLSDRPQMAALPAPARYLALPAPPPTLALPAPVAEAPAMRAAAVRTPSVAALPEPPAADLGLFARAGEQTLPPRRDEIASLPPTAREPAAPLPAPVAAAPLMAAPEMAAPVMAVPEMVAPEMVAPVAAAPVAPAPVAPPPIAPPTMAAAPMPAATAPAVAAPTAGPRDYPLLPPPRRPVSADGRVSSVEPAPGQGHLELPPDFLPGLRADRGPAPSRTLASADGGFAASRGAQTAPVAEGPATASIVFGAGGADLPRTADGDVEEVARRLLQDPALRVQVRAYADGADDANKRQLSLYRALSVRSALIEEGVRSTRIAVQALGGQTQMNPRDRVDLVVMRS